MKRLLKFVLILVVFVSCSTDNFYETKRTLQTDKTDYKIGEKISLILKIQPEKSEKLIKIYRNYQNLQVSFSLLNYDVHNSNGKIEKRENVPNSEIESITITKHKPFEKTFAGNIIDNADSVKIEFLELNTSANFAKKDLINGKVRIHGLCIPINPEAGASLEEYFDIVDVKIH